MLVVSPHSINSFSIYLAENIYHDEEFESGRLYIETSILWGRAVCHRIYAFGGGKWVSIIAGLRIGAGEKAGIQEA
jgi:hypothetical protein